MALFLKCNCSSWEKNFMAPFMDGVQLPQGRRHLEVAV